jgi:putative FmdB family regulatory protein
MRLFDFECRDCGDITEEYLLTGEDRHTSTCPICGGESRKIYTISDTRPVDSPWIAGVREVVDKKSNKPWCKEFLRHPTRANLKAWMKGEGLRHRDPAEPFMPKINHQERKATIKRRLLEQNRQREAITING